MGKRRIASLQAAVIGIACIAVLLAGCTGSSTTGGSNTTVVPTNRAVDASAANGSAANASAVSDGAVGPAGATAPSALTTVLPPSAGSTQETPGAAGATAVAGATAAGADAATASTGSTSPGSTSVATTTAAPTGTGCTIDFAGSPVSGHAPLAGTFTSLTPCEVDRRYWNFGDSGVDGTTIGYQNETNACDRARDVHGVPLRGGYG